MPTTQTQPLPEASASRRALAGFFLSGLILSFPGAVLPAWGYHIRPHFVTLGHYFLAVVAGVLLAVGVPKWRQRSTTATLVLGCASAFVSFLLLSLTAPPVQQAWRLPGLAGLGFSAGLINTGVFQALSAAYRLNRAATVNLAGIFFGLGSAVTPLLIAGTFNRYSVRTSLIVISLVPALFALLYAKSPFAVEQPIEARSARQVMREFAVPVAILLSLLLFCHFGNEWAIAGWLPLFLILRLGLSPVSALVLLAAYWFSIVLGRAAVQSILPRVPHGRLLLSCVLASLLGCLILSFTNNAFGAWTGTLLIGTGFAPIYPLAVEAIAARFPHYHPGVFNGIFSVGLTGGMLAPATLGYASEYAGIRVVALLPAAGTFAVLVLVLAIWLEARISGWNSANPHPDRTR